MEKFDIGHALSEGYYGDILFCTVRGSVNEKVLVKRIPLLDEAKKLTMNDNAYGNAYFETKVNKISGGGNKKQQQHANTH